MNLCKEWNITVVSHTLSLILQTKTITVESILQDLQKNEEELLSLLSTIQSSLQSSELEYAIRYFSASHAYITKKDILDISLCSVLQQVIKRSQSIEEMKGILLDKQQYDCLLDDLYCLDSFFKEKSRLITKDSIVIIHSSPAVAGMIN